MTASSLYNLILISSTFLTAALGAWAIYHRTRGYRAFALLMLALSWWTYGYARELASQDLEQALLWVRLEYVSIVSVPPLWLLFALRDRGPGLGPGGWARAALFVPPAITLGLALTNEQHGLLWAEVGLVRAGELTLFTSVYGPWFWVHALYSYSLIIAGSVLLLRTAWQAGQPFKVQGALLTGAALLPLAGNVIYVAGLSWISLDLTPLLFTLSALLLTVASYNSRLLSIVPVARNWLIEQMTDLVLVTDERGRLVDLNLAAKRTLGLGDRALGQTLAAAAPGLAGQLAALAQPLELTLGEGDGATVYDVQRQQLVDGRGQTAGALVVLRNITQRRRAEESLRAQKELFAAVAAVAQAAAAGPTLHKTLSSVLTSAAELTGAVEGSICLLDEDGSAVQLVLYGSSAEPGAGQPDMGPILEHGLAGRAVHTREAVIADDIADDRRWLHQPGAVQSGSALAVPILEGERAVGVITLCHSRPGFFQAEHARLMGAAAVQIALAISNAQMYETQRQLAEQAEAASRSKSAFLAVMSHELRTPLNVVIGYSELIADELPLRGAADLLPDLAQVVGAARQLLSLVDDVLALSRIEAGQERLITGPVDLTALVFHVGGAMRQQAAQNGNTLEIDCPDDLGIEQTDLAKLQQILLQLLSNACKFTEGGQIVLRARREPAGAGPEPRQAVIFEVSDTGIGMSEDQLDGLFEEFRQGDSSSTRRYGGIGLGLALCQRLSRLLGATIAVESRPRQGSTFRLRLPVAPGPAAP